jgi:hypothetical protein
MTWQRLFIFPMIKICSGSVFQTVLRGGAGSVPIFPHGIGDALREPYTGLAEGALTQAMGTPSKNAPFIFDTNEQGFIAR